MPPQNTGEALIYQICKKGLPLTRELSAEWLTEGEKSKVIYT